MAALLEIPRIKNTKAFHLKRWAEVYADPELHRYPGRVETNRFGQILMMPPPGFPHSSRQSEISYLLRTLLSGGRPLTECAVLTSDGVKGVDVAWISEGRTKRGLKGEVLTIAPKICVEVTSPKNTRQELVAKRDLYFEAGADEVWFCDKHGVLHYFLHDSGGREVKASRLCLAMPRRIKA